MALARRHHNGRYKGNGVCVGDGTGFDLDEEVYVCEQPEHALGIVEPDPEDYALEEPGAVSNPQVAECSHFDPVTTTHLRRKE